MKPDQRVKGGLTHAGEFSNQKKKWYFFIFFCKIQLKDLPYFINRSFSFKFITHVVWIEWIDTGSSIDKYW